MPVPELACTTGRPGNWSDSSGLSCAQLSCHQVEMESSSKAILYTGLPSWTLPVSIIPIHSPLCAPSMDHIATTVGAYFVVIVEVGKVVIVVATLISRAVSVLTRVVVATISVVVVPLVVRRVVPPAAEMVTVAVMVISGVAAVVTVGVMAMHEQALAKAAPLVQVGVA